MNINNSDLIWNYISTFLKIGGGIILLPFILVNFSSQEVGIWSIFNTVVYIISLFDFGFGPSFTRNVTYIFSGVKELKEIGITNSQNCEVDYNLLKGLISCMKGFYRKLAIIVLVLLLSIGTFYLFNILTEYKGNKLNIYIAWFLLCIICSYNLYTLYYDSLLIGKGNVKQAKQITTFSQIMYLIVATVCIEINFGLLSIVLAQLISIVINRTLSHNNFYNSELKSKLNKAEIINQSQIFKSIYPNAIKVGLTTLGGFLVNRSTLLIGSLYIPLHIIGSYGITIQIIAIISSLGSIYTYTFLPKISNCRIIEDYKLIKKIYTKGVIALILTFCLAGSFLVCIGNDVLSFLGSNTHLLPRNMIFLLLLFALLEINHSMSANVILTKNEVPFYKASLISGASVVILLLILLNYTDINVLALILAPGIVQLMYQNWKWPLDVIKDLNKH